MSATDWPAYLAGFHGERPGITEEILARCHDRGRTPYEWLLEGVDPQDRILDLGCGSAPARPEGASRWLGIDRADAELRVATSRGRGPVALADASRMPVGSASMDVVTAAMSLMLVHPLEVVLGEIARVLRPGGRLLLLLPDRGPLAARDRLTYLRLFWAMRSPTHFPPTPLRRNAGPTFGAAGLEVIADQSRRFLFSATTPEQAERFVTSWYLPRTSPAGTESGRARAARLAPFDIGIPFRRLVVSRPAPADEAHPGQ